MCINFARSPLDKDTCLILIDHETVCWLHKADFEKIKELMGWD
jgi:hypothetical protein